MVMGDARGMVMRADGTDPDGWRATLVAWGTPDVRRTSVTVRDGRGVVRLRAVVDGDVGLSDETAEHVILACRDVVLPALGHALGMDGKDDASND